MLHIFFPQWKHDYYRNNARKLFISCMYFTFLNSVKGASHREGLPFDVA